MKSSITRLILPLCSGIVLAGAALALFWGEASGAGSRDTADLAKRQTTAATPPAGQNALKIFVNQTGLHEITRADLAAAGFDPAAVDPRTLQLAHRGRTVAYQWQGDNDPSFEEGESLRFFGRSYQDDPGSWLEKQYATHNIYWLWAGGTRLLVPHPPPSATIGATPVTTYTAVLKTEIDDLFSSTKISRARWELSGVEPDSMYWTELLRSQFNQTVTAALTVSLPHVDPTGANAVFTHAIVVEGRLPNQLADGNAIAMVNSHPVTVSQYYQSRPFAGGMAFSLTQTVPVAALNPGPEQTITFTNTPGANGFAPTTFLINHITAAYPATLSAVDDTLFFTKEGSGSLDFRIDQLTSSNPAGLTVWNVTDPYEPVPLGVRYLNGSGSSHTFAFGAAQSGTTSYLVAAESGLVSPDRLETVSIKDLEPAGGGAEWLAISHAGFLPAATTLAAHRAAYSDLTTQVVDVADVYNRYGDGFPSPEAIKNYLQHAYDSWDTPVRYVVLVGDGHYNPRMLPCSQCNEGSGDWSYEVESHIPFYYAFEDRFQGLVPSDYDYMLLAGDDLRPDIALGRLGVETLAQANQVVEKIVRYEENLLDPQTWQKEFLFMHDFNKNPGDNFLKDVEEMLPFIPEEYTNHIIGYESYQNYSPGTDPVQNAMIDLMNSGVLIVNYRGHGSVTNWSDNRLLYTDLISAPDPLNNVGKPFISLSMDCLDGNFAYPGWHSLSETMIRLDDRGAAAHWSSTGLGYPFEHDILGQNFYAGLFDKNLTALGDAINYAKTRYHDLGYHESELYAFTLQGDPAMQVLIPEYDLFLPVIQQ